MKTPLLASLTLLLSLAALTAHAQLAVPEPTQPNEDLPIQLDASNPLDSLENQLLDASYDQRGALATAFDTAVLAVDERIAEVRSQGLIPSDEALSNVQDAREAGRGIFRDMSLVTEETWRTGRHSGLMALRKIRSSLEVLLRTARPPS